ncbi:heavy-metal-associated domain-containing protein [Dactylococcopsis salina]|uniref:Copper chaperone n=1 Tax=Dactylococcopsis salina (strain PCC 8305) TaxID=13035 RepID=K9YUG6_DACS8|nr:cation transporter [Dactylococcopsis salina]AFZ50544.1 copper chaperone [Dactylococcopsis salina PCC 8305]
MIALNVPTIKCEGCAEAITNEIKTHDPNAQVNVDVENKIVNVETSATEAAVKDMITAAGHSAA